MTAGITGGVQPSLEPEEARQGDRAEQSVQGGIMAQIREAMCPVASVPEERISPPEVEAVSVSGDGTSLTEEAISNITTTEATLRREWQSTQEMVNAYATRVSVPDLSRYVSFDPANVTISALDPLAQFVQEAPKLPPDTQWEKIWKSRQPIKKKIVHILSHVSQKQTDEILQELNQKDNEILMGRKTIRNGNKRIKEMICEEQELTLYHKQLTAEVQNEKAKRFEVYVEKIEKLPSVQKIEIDEQKRITVTTKSLFVKKDDWDKPRNAGSYQIRIDLYKPHIDDGIRVLNITKRFQHYDHPCINNTKCCWGNVNTDIKKDFRRQNLLELVEDMFAYLISPNDQMGFLRYSKNPPTEMQKRGWEQFLEFSTPMPKGFCFAVHDKLRQEETNHGLTVTDDMREPATTTNTITMQRFPPQSIQPPEPPLPVLCMADREWENKLVRVLTPIILEHINNHSIPPPPSENMEISSVDVTRMVVHEISRAISHNFIFIKRLIMSFDGRVRIDGQGVEHEERIFVHCSELISQSRMLPTPRELFFPPPHWAFISQPITQAPTTSPSGSSMAGGGVSGSFELLTIGGGGGGTNL